MKKRVTAGSLPLVLSAHAQIPERRSVSIPDISPGAINYPNGGITVYTIEVIA
jgi:hypothetical protein